MAYLNCLQMSANSRFVKMRNAGENGVMLDRYVWMNNSGDNGLANSYDNTSRINYPYTVDYEYKNGVLHQYTALTFQFNECQFRHKAYNIAEAIRDSNRRDDDTARQQARAKIDAWTNNAVRDRQGLRAQQAMNQGLSWRF